MFNLNNKGMTIVEILICFLLVSFITVALFSTVSTFNNKRDIESTKGEIITYRNQIVKLIEDDLINKGLSNAVITPPKSGAAGDDRFQYKVQLYFRDGTNKILKIYSKRAGDYNATNKNLAPDEESSCTGYSDEFYIKYDNIRYDLPNVGEFENKDCGEIIKDLRFNTIKVNSESNVLTIYINFYHPEIGSDYSINIIAPINYFY